MSNSGRRGSGCLACAVAMGIAQAALATPVTFVANQGNLHSSVTFNTSGTNLIITLTNISPVDVLTQADVLSGIYFDVVNPAVSLTPVSAIVPGGSVVLFGTTDPGNSVGGEWFYNGNLSGAPFGERYGAAAVDLGLFTFSPNFNGSNLQGPVTPEGIEYGITSAGDNPVTGGSDVTGANALIKNQVVLTLSGLPAGFDPFARIINVAMQYGSELTGPHPQADRVPEPGTLGLLTAGASMAFRKRRR